MNLLQHSRAEAVSISHLCSEIVCLCLASTALISGRVIMLLSYKN